ncbi:MAG: PD-(D/E)XK nuclease family protein [Terriglobales bacterium]
MAQFPLTLCAHPRLAHELHAAYDKAQAAHHRSWPSAPIFTLDAWLERLWAQAGDAMLLTAWQQTLLWRQIIAAHAGAHDALDLDATAEAASEAWRLAQQWKLPLAGAAGDGWQEREEPAAFQQWALEFQRRCRAEQWHSPAELPSLIAVALATGRVPAPPALRWVGFDDPTPLQLDLLSAFHAAGTSVDASSPAAAPALPRVCSFREPALEMVQAARWARAQVDEDPGARIGVVVPGLAAQRELVERVFLDVLHPRRAPWDNAPRAFHLSLGPPLAQAPPLAAALRLVAVLSTPGPVPLGDVLDWIRSPYLEAGDAEASLRARLEHTLRRQQRELWRWSELARWAARECPVLARGLERAHRRMRRWPPRQSHQRWAEAWAELWEALGWPGERTLDSAAWQSVAAWQRLLDDFGRLDQVAPAPVDATTALARLHRAAASRPFQPQAPPAPVQVLGWWEAAGLSFSHLWVCGMQESALPPAPHPHPFLPLSLQRERHMPHASAEQEAAVALRHWQRLCATSHTVTASFALADAAGRPLLPSPLLAGLDVLDVSPPHQDAASAPVETLDDHLAPPATANERRAGSSLFLDQSACPFRAFSHRRLHAQSPEDLAVGLPATTRGSLLHRVLHDLWAEPEAAVLSPERIARLAAAAVAAESSLAARPALAATEAARLTSTVLAWCEIERQRQPHRVVAREHRLQVEFAGLDLDLRRDRIDELPDGSLVLLDYKSGRCSASTWLEPYPEQPQLPLYAVTEPRRSQVAAIAFAQLRTGDMKLLGLERAPAIVLSAPLPHGKLKFPSWNEQLARWQHALEVLAAEYLRGEARVDPRQRASCRYCDLPALCRIREHGLAAAADDELEEDDGESD